MSSSDGDWSAADRRWMARALALAALADGQTSPNPLVGAVVLDAGGGLVGEGFHRRAGAPHAEVVALAQAGPRARGGTLYVSLEPCCHHGRTPPCSELVVGAGLARVVVARQDPDPRVAGAGLAALAAAGISVSVGLCSGAASALNRPFLHRLATGRALGVLKWAASLDGRQATSDGHSQWISGVEARRWVHSLRARCDAVVIGGGTLRADDPLLTSRGQRSPEPLRVVFSRSLALPAEARLWDQGRAPTLVVHGPAPTQRCNAIDDLGVDRLALAEASPRLLAEALAARGCNRILWECGPALAAAALREGCLQTIEALEAPLLIGGCGAATPLADFGVRHLDQALRFAPPRLQRLGPDLRRSVELP